MTVFSVDSEAVLAQAAGVQGTAERLRSESQAMLAQLTQLESSWTGRAAVAFRTTIEQWRATQRQVEESLTAITHAMTAASRQYADAETAAAALFR